MTSKDASSQDMRDDLIKELRDRANRATSVSLVDLLYRAAAALSTTPDIGEPPLRGLKEGWRDIETAPDERAILYAPPERLYSAPKGQAGIIHLARPANFTWATHWMPLPAPPQAPAAFERLPSSTLHPDTKSKIDVLEALGSGGLK